MCRGYKTEAFLLRCFRSMVRWEEKQVNIIQAESIFYRKNEIEHIHVMDSQKDVIRDDRFN